MFCTGSVQEVMDMAAVAHLATLKTRIPFMHFFDGFRTSHEVQKVEVMEYDALEKLLDKEAVAEFRARSLNPDQPVIRGTAQNPDIYFQTREAVNSYYEKLPAVVENYMNEISKITGRKYGLFNYYGAQNVQNHLVSNLTFLTQKWLVPYSLKHQIIRTKTPPASRISREFP